MTTALPPIRGAPSPPASSPSSPGNLRFWSAFVPHAVLDYLAGASETEARVSDRAARVTHLEAACAFFDISGFSKLSDKLQTREATSTALAQRAVSVSSATSGGKASSYTRHANLGLASEDLVRFLNQTLSEVVGETLSRGGDIISFAGDAIIVLFSGEELSMCAWRAAACARVCIDAREGSDLGLHAGLAAGSVALLHVGGVQDLWETTVVGAPLLKMFDAEGVAGVGEAVLHLSAAELLPRAELTASDEEPGFFRLGSLPTTLPPTTNALRARQEVTAAALRAYVPGPVMALHSSSAASLQSLRKTTVLFIRLCDITKAWMESTPLDKVAKSLHARLRRIQEAMYDAATQATLRQFIVDDKGAVAIAALGVPPYFHEDNADRAVKLALRLATRYPVSIGVTTGEAYCGIVGSPQRMEYSIVGDCVNFSARLMSKAQAHEVLMDATTHDEQRSAAASVRPVRESIAVKGKARPATVYRVCCTPASSFASQLFDDGDGDDDNNNDNDDNGNGNGNEADSHHSTTNLAYALSPEYVPSVVVGRGGEEKQLAAAIRASKVAVVIGRVRMGKSLLLRAVRHDTVLASRATAENTGTNYGSWRPLMRAMLELPFRPEDGPAAAPRPASSPSPSPKPPQNHLARLMRLGSGNAASGASSRWSPPNSTSERHSAGSCSTTRGRQRWGVAMLTATTTLAGSRESPLVQELLYEELLETTDLRTLDAAFSPRSAFKDRGPVEVARILCIMLRELARVAPVTLVMDDAHLMDAHSWAVLTSVALGVPEAALVLTVDQAVADKTPGYLLFKAAAGATDRLCPIPLPPLRHYDVLKLVIDRAQVSTVEPSVVDTLYERSKGNPGSVVALLQVLHSQGAIRRMGDRLEVIGDLSVIDDNATQQERAEVTRRYDSLQPPARLLLSMLAVVGDEAPVNLVRWLCAQTPAPAGEEGSSPDSMLDSPLQTLVTEGFVKALADDADDTILFAAEHVRHTVYQLVLHSERERFHAQVVDWFVNNLSETQLRPELEDLGYHCVCSRQWARAVDLLSHAASVQRINGNSSRALELAQDCLDLIYDHELFEDLTRVARVLILQALCRTAEGEYALAVAALDALLARLPPVRLSVGLWRPGRLSDVEAAAEYATRLRRATLALLSSTERNLRLVMAVASEEPLPEQRNSLMAVTTEGPTERSIRRLSQTWGAFGTTQRVGASISSGASASSQQWAIHPPVKGPPPRRRKSVMPTIPSGSRAPGALWKKLQAITKLGPRARARVSSKPSQ